MATLDDDKLRVLEASDIAEVVGEYVRLVPNGREFKCLCPFHDDNNPSMYVVPHKRMFHCFVCGAGGDVFTFIERYHGIEFMDAMRMLAERAGIELTPREKRTRSDPDAPEVSRGQLLEANKVAQAFFRAILRDHPSGEAARALVNRRGIAPEMVERFGIGASPDRWDGLLATIRRKGLPEAPFLVAGLLKRREKPEPYDALRNRLIFPIHGETGEPIAFGGRRVNDEDEPKYLNSPETPLFVKNKTLFGLPMARSAMRESGRAVVVEGYTDVIACHQAGLTNVVGTLGTAFTAGHAQKLRGQCGEVVLLFDGDEAGQNAADRAIDVLIAARVDIRVAMLTGATDAKDPDELLARDGGVEELRAILDRAEPVLERWARRVHERQAGLGPAGRARLLDEQIARFAQVGLEALSPIERASMLESLAAALGVPGRVVTETYEKQRRPGRRPEGEGGRLPAVAGPIALRPIDRFRLIALSCLMDAPVPTSLERGRLTAALRVELKSCHPAVRGAMEAAVAAVERGEEISPSTLLAPVVETPAASSALAAVLAAGREASDPEGLVACVARLEEYALVSPGADASPAGAADRLARLRALHDGHGGNRGANPYRFAGSARAATPRGGFNDADRYDHPPEGVRSDDGEDHDDNAGAAPGPQ